MVICLINPKRHPWAKTQKISLALRESHKYLKAWYSPSLSLLTIAALTPRNVQIDLINEDFTSIDYERYYDVVGITAMAQTSYRAYHIAREFRKRGIYVVLGGIHASVMPEEAARHVDTVIVGEAEQLWPQFLEDFQNGKAQKIYRNPQGYRIDITKSPLPRYDLLRDKEYILNPDFYYNFIPVQTSRGCPHGCEFCVVSDLYGKQTRKKKLEQVRDEISAIKKNLPNHLILFADDNLFLDRRYAKSLLLELERLQIRWVGQSDIAVGGYDELLELLHKSGCLFLLIGFESLNPQNLANLNRDSWKLRQLQNFEIYIRKIQEHGIMVFGSFIFGFDHDDKSVFSNVVDFMNRNNIAGQMTFATPLPGSRMFARLKHENRFLYPEPFWERCTFLDVIFKMKRMSKDEAEDGLIWAYKQIFNEKAFKERASYFKEIYKKLSE